MDENENLIPESMVFPDRDYMPFEFQEEDPKKVFGDEWEMPLDRLAKVREFYF